MTDDRAMKKTVRARMAQTGEKYTEALRAVKTPAAAEPSRPPSRRHLTDELRPESVTAVVSGSGATNLALILPDLIALRDAGHPVVIAAHERGGGVGELPSPLDFAYASGLATIEEVQRAVRSQDRDALMSIDSRGTRGITFLGRPLTTSEWREALDASGSGKEPVLWVPDIQVDAPLADWPVGTTLSEFDQIPVQLSGLRDLARYTGAIIGVGHCSPADFEHGWRIVAEIADQTVIIDEEVNTSHGPRSDTRKANLRFVNRWGAEQNRSTTIDISFWDWRTATWAA